MSDKEQPNKRPGFGEEGYADEVVTPFLGGLWNKADGLVAGAITRVVVGERQKRWKAERKRAEAQKRHDKENEKRFAEAQKKVEVKGGSSCRTQALVGLTIGFLGCAASCGALLEVANLVNKR